MNGSAIKIIPVSIVVLVLVSSTVSASLRGKIKEGNKLFLEGNHEQALERYRDAQLDSPDLPELHFNIGDALYRGKQYEKAIEEFRKAAANSRDVLLQSKAYYNTGNCFYRLNKLKESILAYKRALDLNPDDMEAKANLEFVQRKLKEMARKQPSQNPAGRDKAGQQKEADSPEGKDSDKNRKKSQGKPPQPQKKAGADSTGKGTNPKQGKKMTPEEVERFLKDLRDQERQAQMDRIRRLAGGKYRVDKDW